MKDKSDFNYGFMVITVIAMFLFSFGIIVPSCFSASEKANFIQNFDKDNDGKVSKEEFAGPEKAFNNFDKNQDGFIDESEAPKGPPPNSQKKQVEQACENINTERICFEKALPASGSLCRDEKGKIFRYYLQNKRLNLGNPNSF